MITMGKNLIGKKIGVIFIINEEITFDPDKCIIRNIMHNQEIRLNMPASRCLTLLLMNPHSVISREHFLEEVWQKNGVVVSQNTYYQNISILRKTLKQAGLRGEFIVTVPHKGLTLCQNITITHQKIRETDPENDVIKMSYNKIHNMKIAPQAEKKESSRKALPFFNRGEIRFFFTDGDECRHIFSMILIALIISVIITLINSYAVNAKGNTPTTKEQKSELPFCFAKQKTGCSEIVLMNKRFSLSQNHAVIHKSPNLSLFR